MAMTPRQMAEFFVEQGELFHQGMVETADLSPEELVFSAAETFKAKAVAGLILWRHGLSDPRDQLGEAVATARQFLEGKGSQARNVTEFPIASACYLAELCSQPWAAMRDLIGGAIPRPTRLVATEQSLDGTLLDAMGGASLPHSWPDGVANKPSLLVLSYRCYGTLIRARPEQRQPLVREAETLFRKRRRDGYYSGGSQLHGGGPDNDHVVDFVLAAVLKHIGASALSIEHGWRGSEA